MWFSLSDCMIDSVLFRGRLLYLFLFVHFVKYYFDQQREHQVNKNFQLNFTQCMHAHTNQSRIASLFSIEEDMIPPTISAQSCNIKTVLSILALRIYQSFCSACH